MTDDATLEVGRIYGMETAKPIPWKQLRDAVDGLSSALMIFDENLNVLFANRATATLLDGPLDVERSRYHLHGLLTVCAVLDEAGVAKILEAAAAAMISQAAALPFVLTAGVSRHLVVQAHVTTAGPGLWTLSCRDITQQHGAERRAIDLASRDPLTGLANRTLFIERIGKIAAEAPGAATWMMLLDLDRFKAVNDTLGHPTGDALLKLVARRLSSALREGDFVARLGGDEFALLIHSCSDAGAAAKLALRLIDVIGRPYLIDGHLVHIGASLGIGSTEGMTNQEQLFKRADLALYAAKEAGRDTFCFFESAMDERAYQRRVMEIDLRKAIALRQLELHYQPQIDLDRNTVVGFEALVRWRHPTRGLVPPGDFIPLAEELGLIVSMGEWILREACREAAAWPDAISIAVNVSACQFERPQALIAAIDRALKASGLPGHRLEIEITESALLRNKDAVFDTLHTIRANGVRVAMDDFGTGYSSLSQLNSFPFDKIKIDRSFVSGKGKSADRNAIVRAITALGVSLGMTTIAEGVETSEELARIRASGCTSVQGYLFSKPVPIEEVDDLINQFTTPTSSSRAA